MVYENNMGKRCCTEPIEVNKKCTVRPSQVDCFALIILEQLLRAALTHEGYHVVTYKCECDINKILYAFFQPDNGYLSTHMRRITAAEK